jgi:hypothetical protein
VAEDDKLSLFRLSAPHLRNVMLFEVSYAGTMAQIGPEKRNYRNLGHLRGIYAIHMQSP